MKKWFEMLSYKTQQWMHGRYGDDELNRFLCIVSLVFFILSLFTPVRFLSVPAILLILWSCIRCNSKNITDRMRERQTYLALIGRLKSWQRLQRNKWRDRKGYRYFQCKNCRAALRVPRGKGKIRIHCPKCHNEIQAKT